MTATTKRKRRNPPNQRAIAKKAAAARHSVDSYIRSIAARAPELTPEQRDRLAAILRGEASET